MVAQRKTTEPIDAPILREMVKQDRLLEWSDYYRSLDTLPSEQSTLLEPDAQPPALKWTPEAQRLYHRIKAELWPGDALVCGLWRLELYQPERLHFKPVERTVAACSHTTRQTAWWGHRAWFKTKYRFNPWMPCRRFWKKREVMGKPYFRLVCGLREVCIEHIDPATQGWLQKQFAMYLAARGVMADSARVMLLPIALDREVAPTQARNKRNFERTEEVESVEALRMDSFAEVIKATVYIGKRGFDLQLRVQEQGVVKDGRYLILATDTATGMMACKAVGLADTSASEWAVLPGSFVPDVYQQKGE